MDTIETVEKSVKSFIRALALDSRKKIYQHHRKLYKHGVTVIPALEEFILAQPWGKIKHGHQIFMLTGILGLINDIDEERAAEVVQKIQKKGCNKMVEVRMLSVVKFSLSQFEFGSILGVNTYISKELSGHSVIRKKMLDWLSKVPSSDLCGIERFYITSELEEDYRGAYMPILSDITVVWLHGVSYYSPLSYPLLFQIEKTFYHEIGHHVHRHTFGQDPEQEKEADEYAEQFLKMNHPFLKIVVRTVRYVFGEKNEN